MGEGTHLQRDQTLDRSLVVLQKTTSNRAVSLKMAVTAPQRQQKHALSRKTSSTPGTTCTQRRASRLETWLGVLPSALRTASASSGLTIQGCPSVGWKHLIEEEVHPQRGQSLDRKHAGLQVLYQKNL